MIYIAGPFFTKEERNQLDQMIKAVREQFPSEKLFIPMEHKIPNGEKMSNNEWAKKVFDMDVNALLRCNKMFALYGGLYSDTGTAWEMGYAHALGIPVYICFMNPNETMSLMAVQGSVLIDEFKEAYNQK